MYLGNGTSRIPTPPLVLCPFLISVAILVVAPDHGRYVFIAGYMISLNSISVSILADRGYFNFVGIFICRAVHAYLAEASTILTFPPQYAATYFSS